MCIHQHQLPRVRSMTNEIQRFTALLQTSEMLIEQATKARRSGSGTRAVATCCSLWSAARERVHRRIAQRCGAAKESATSGQACMFHEGFASQGKCG